MDRPCGGTNLVWSCGQYPSGWNPYPTFSLTTSGQQKLQYLLQEAHAAQQNGWNISFGFSNEANNAHGFITDAGNTQVYFGAWWPMDARHYAAFYKNIGSYIRSYMITQWNWSPALVLGECSYYVPCMCDILDEAGVGHSGVPPVPPEPEYVDTRYPNLVIGWHDFDYGSEWSDGQGHSIFPAAITFHLYNNDIYHYQGGDPTKPDTLRNRLGWALDPNNLYSFRYSGNRSGQGNFASIIYALTEWGTDATSLYCGDVRVWLTNVWNMLNNDPYPPTGQLLYSMGLRSAYWYCDYCHVSYQKGVFVHGGADIQPPPYLTDPTHPNDCFLQEPPAGCCGTTFAAI